MIKSMSIPTKWANHKPENDYTTDVVPRREDSEFHVKLPSLRVLQKEESPEGPALNIHRTEGNRDSTLGGCTASLMCTRTQGRKTVTP